MSPPITGRGFEPITERGRPRHSKPFSRSPFCTRIDIQIFRSYLCTKSDTFDPSIAQESILSFCACLEYSVT